MGHSRVEVEISDLERKKSTVVESTRLDRTAAHAEAE